MLVPADILNEIGALPAQQQIDWPDLEHLSRVVAELEQKEGLTTISESDRLTHQLGRVVAGEAMVLHGGSCADSLDDNPYEATKALLEVMLPMTTVLAYGAGVQVVKITRNAGQMAKPRSSPTETRGNLTLQSYFGDMVNDVAFTEESRRPDPDRLLRGLDHAKDTIHAMKGLATGGFADLERMHEWNVKFATNSSEGERYRRVAREISYAIRFMKASGVNTSSLQELHEAEVYVSHEALILPYELALTRQNKDGRLHDTSAHLVWIGERTRNPDEAHVALAAAICNPVSVKLGPKTTPEEVRRYCEILNPDRIPGRLTLIPRMGADKIDEALPPLLEEVKRGKYPVVWIDDPLHANTETVDGQKTRRFDKIIKEEERFFEICEAADVWGGGLHLEMTGDNVTECLGGSDPYAGTDLNVRYTTKCDPRLNPTQSIELAFRVAEHRRG